MKSTTILSQSSSHFSWRFYSLLSLLSCMAFLIISENSSQLDTEALSLHTHSNLMIGEINFIYYDKTSFFKLAITFFESGKVKIYITIISIKSSLRSRMSELG